MVDAIANVETYQHKKVCKSRNPVLVSICKTSEEGGTITQFPHQSSLLFGLCVLPKNHYYRMLVNKHEAQQVNHL